MVLVVGRRRWWGRGGGVLLFGCSRRGVCFFLLPFLLLGCWDAATV